MLQYPKFVVVIVVLFLTSSLILVQAQTKDDADIDASLKLSGIQVLGTSDTIASLVEINLNARAGTPIETIDLQVERNRVLSMGRFAEVSLRIENRAEGPVLLVRVRENPRIGEITIEGTSQNTEGLLGVLEEVNLLRIDGVYNTVRAKEGIKTLQQAYKQLGWPFDVPVSVRSEPLQIEDTSGEGPVKLTYSITEELPVSSIVFKGNTAITDDSLAKSFKPIETIEVFNFDLYNTARREVSNQYRDLGYFGSGVDSASSDLSDDVLTIVLRELVIASIDTTAVGIDPNKLSLSSGDLFNYDALLSDVKNLSQGRTSDINISYATTPQGEVRVRLALGPPASAGKITHLEIRGNSVISNEELIQLLRLKVGDTFTSALAQDDFRRIQEKYTEKGFAIVPEANFNYEEGKYIQNVKELKIQAYDIIFDSEKARTSSRVVARYLPTEGSVYSQDKLRSGLLNASRLGIVEPLDVQLRFPDAENPDEATVLIEVAERPSRNFSPSLNYTTDQGLSTQVAYTDSNFLGLAHSFSVSLSGFSSDTGLLLGGEVGYKVPWIDINFLDFKKVPTSFGVSVFSLANANQALIVDGDSTINHPCIVAGTCEDIEQNRVDIGEYNRRDTGLRLSIGRPIFDFTNLSFSARGSYTDYTLEPPEESCIGSNGEIVNTIDNNGNITNNTSCALEESDSQKFLPRDGLSSFLGSGITFDNRDRLEFPTEGFKFSVRGGIGFGNDHSDPTTGNQKSYVYEQVEFGARTYFALGKKNHVVAFRVNAGHQFGGDYPSSKFFSVGDTGNEITQIRGFDSNDFNRSESYAIGSMEYRYNFGLSTAVTQTVIGILFADLGYASQPERLADDEVPLFGSGGVGLQVNIGFGGGILAPIRLDYGFSERHPAGHLSFRIGFVY